MTREDAAFTTVLEHTEAGQRQHVLWVLMRSALCGAALLVVYAMMPLDGVEAGLLAGMVLGLVALVIVLVWQVRAVTRSVTPRLRAVEALAMAFPFFIVLFAAAYNGLSRIDPNAFTEPVNRADALYFTVSTFATVGFGDIAAVTGQARLVVTVQILVGLILLGGFAKVLLRATQVGIRKRAKGSDPADRSPSAGRGGGI